MTAKFISSGHFPPIDKRIQVGRDSNAPYLAFGDDSQYKGALTFAYVVIPKVVVNKVMRDLAKLKQKFKFPEGTPIHCRVMFSPQQRQKANLSHLTNDEAMQIVHHCVTLVNMHRLYVRYAFALEENWKQIWDGKQVTELYNEKGELQLHPSTQDPKGVLGSLAQACWAPLINGAPKSIEGEMYASKDSTMTSFIGEKRRQAHNWIKGLTNIDAADGYWNEIAPSFEPGPYESLLELADVVSYAICHAVHGRANEPKFADAVTRIRWHGGAEFNLDLDRPAPAKPRNPFA